MEEAGVTGMVCTHCAVFNVPNKKNCVLSCLGTLILQYKNIVYRKLSVHAPFFTLCKTPQFPTKHTNTHTN